MKQTLTDDLRAAFGWLASELRSILRPVREQRLWLALLVALLLWVAAYQVGSAWTLPIGGDQRTGLRHYDEPFLQGFHAPEPDDDGPDWADRPDAPYRWSSDNAALVLPGIGAGEWRIRVLAASGRPDGSSAVSQWAVGSAAPAEIAVAAQPRVYELAGRAENGTLRLQLVTPAFHAPGDPRRLGIVVYRVSVAPLERRLIEPSGAQLALQLAFVLAAYGVARRLGAPSGWAGLGVLALAVAGAWLLATDRLGLAVVMPRLAILAGLSVLLAPIVLGLVRRGAAAVGGAAAGAAPGAVAALVLAGFWVRMAGLLHPYARFSDLGFHIHNLQRVVAGQVYLLAGLPCEAGAGLAPYPPAMSILLAPGMMLSGPSDMAVRWLVLGGTALLESGAAACIWLLVRWSGWGQRAALVGAALYVVATPLLGAYSIGEIANIFGQVWLAPLLLVLARWHTHSRWNALWGGVLAAALFLSHAGVTLSTLALLAAWLVIALALARGALPDRIRALAPAVLAFGCAGIGAALLFYSAYSYLPAANQATVQALAAQTPPLVCPPGYPLADKLARTLALGLGAQGSLTIPLAVAAVVGVLLAWRSPPGAVLTATLAGALLSFATLLTSDQPVRWAHFVYPALCVAGALALTRWWQRGLSGRVLACAVVAWALWFGLAQWVGQITRYLH